MALPTTFILIKFNISQNDLCNCAASRFTHGKSLSRQPKRRVGDVINDVRINLNLSFQKCTDTNIILHSLR